MTKLRNIIQWSIVFHLFTFGLCFYESLFAAAGNHDISLETNIPVSEIKAQSRYWNGTWFGTSVTSSNFPVVNSTWIGWGAGFTLASVFFLHTLAYTLENTSNAQSKVGRKKTPLNKLVESIFGPRERDLDNDDDDEEDEDDYGDFEVDSSSVKGNRRLDKGSKKSKKAKKCDCETYCTNKYYYGDGNYDPYTANSDYSTWYNEEMTPATAVTQSASRRKKRG